PLGWSPNLEPTWPRAGVLVWSGGGGGFWPLVADGPVAMGGGVASVVGGGIMRPWWGGNGGRFLAFDVSAWSRPKFVSDLNLTTNLWWSFSSPYTANGLIYVSHETSEFVEGVTLPGQTFPPVITVDPKTGQTVTNQPPIGVWVERYYLDVV